LVFITNRSDYVSALFIGDKMLPQRFYFVKRTFAPFYQSLINLLTAAKSCGNITSCR
jgi:hypothetical protein